VARILDSLVGVMDHPSSTVRGQKQHFPEGTVKWIPFLGQRFKL
jgi:hypothetical protein